MNLFCSYWCIISTTMSLPTVCVAQCMQHNYIKLSGLFLSPASHFNKQSLPGETFFSPSILIFLLPVCLLLPVWPQRVCLESTARPVRHGSTSALLACVLQKATGRDHSESGDRRGGEGEKGEVVLEGKIYKEKGERLGGDDQRRTLIT